MTNWDLLTQHAAHVLPRWLLGRYPTLTLEGAEDACAEALADLWAHRDRLDDQPFPRNYLTTAAVRAAIDAYRDRNRRLTCPLSPGYGERADPTPNPLTSLALQAEVAVLLGLLPPLNARVLWLRYGLGYPEEEVATCVGLTTMAVRMRAHRGRHTARLHLEAVA